MARNKRKGKPKGQPPRPQPPQAAVVGEYEKWKTIRTGILGAVAICFMLATYPTAHTLAGKNTKLDVTISVGIAVTMGAAAGGTALWGNGHRKRANSLDARNAKLVEQIKGLGAAPEDS